MRKNIILALAATALLSAGCATGKKGAEDAAATGGPGAGEGYSEQSGIETRGMGDGSAYGEAGAATAQEAELLGQTVIYFDFDTARVRPEYSEVLAAHARYLAADSTRDVRLEGHADERGSREYNIGLGERRAQAVRQVLMLQGVSPAQITTVSYGEERPAVEGSGEEAWARNRRVEIVY